MTVAEEEAPANYVPAAAVIRRERALSGFTGCKGQVEEQVLTGILKEGDKLPSVRSLSVKLSINPNTIQKAYTELDRRHGSFYFGRKSRIDTK